MRVRESVPLAPLTTLELGGPARRLILGAYPWGGRLLLFLDTDRAVGLTADRMEMSR